MSLSSTETGACRRLSRQAIVDEPDRAASCSGSRRCIQRLVFHPNRSHLFTAERCGASLLSSGSMTPYGGQNKDDGMIIIFVEEGLRPSKISPLPWSSCLARSDPLESLWWVRARQLRARSCTLQGERREGAVLPVTCYSIG
jgi:hypothetical protein